MLNDGMRVRKRSGDLEPVNFNKITKALTYHARGITDVDIVKIASKTIGGLYDGASTSEIDEISIRNCASMVYDSPNYSKLAARIKISYLEKDVNSIGISSFAQSIDFGYRTGQINQRVASFVRKNQRKFNSAIDNSMNDHFHFIAVENLIDRYLIKDAETKKPIETIQYMWMRISCAMTENVSDAVELYKTLANLFYLPSSPTLFNAGKTREQLSSCFLLDSPEDSLDSIYKNYRDIAFLSKFSGGIGVSYSRIRSRGSWIHGTGGPSNGIVPFLKTLDSSVKAVNQGGKRKGACCVYLETWHDDIEDYLSLRDTTGDEESRTRNLNFANWIPDLFMKKVKNGEEWYLFDPAKVSFVDSYGADFENEYEKAVKEKKYTRSVDARKLYTKMMKTLGETGNGWITFKDACNIKNNQTKNKKNVVHSSNLCVEITQVNNKEETSVCNLGSINLAKFFKEDGFCYLSKIDWNALENTISIAVKQLDRVIDINFYTIPETKKSNSKWRPVGLGVMGFQDLLFKMKLSFESVEAKQITEKLMSFIYFHALKESCELAKKNGKHENFEETWASEKVFQFDLWGGLGEHSYYSLEQWNSLKEDVAKYGLRNSMLLAIAPTATIGLIAGVTECIEPQGSNLSKREVASGDFLQCNFYLQEELKKQGLWTKEIISKIKEYEGSIQKIEEIPDHIKEIFKTAYEISNKCIIDLAAIRGKYICQSQSLNLFMAEPTIDRLSSMYFYAWEKGLKTTYYLRSKSKTQIKKIESEKNTKQYSEEEKILCSIENPESCEACQ